MDGKLRRIAQHCNPRIRKAIRGDSIPMLAVRSRALCVGSFLFEHIPEIDALVANEEGETLKDVLREYNISATDDFLQLNNEMEHSMKGILIPSVAENYHKRSNHLLKEQLNLQKLLLLIIENLQKRVALVEKQKWELKKAQLRKQKLAYDTMRSISLEPIALEHIQVII